MKRSDQSLLIRASRLLASVSRFFVDMDYIKIRVWILVVVIIVLAITGHLITKDGLIIGLIISTYVLLTYLIKWFEKRDVDNH